MVQVTDLLPRNQTSLGLSRVSAASQLALVVGPAASALLQAGFAAAGLPAQRCLPGVFVLAAAFSASVLAQIGFDARRRSASDDAAAADLAPAELALKRDDDGPSRAEGEAAEAADVAAGDSAAAVRAAGEGAPLRLAQPMLRSITMVIGWTAARRDCTEAASRLHGCCRLAPS